jgi:tRNA G18 (ribose-2'-O)-methylase SpoU
VIDCAGGVIRVGDVADPRIAEYLGLRDHQLRQRRERDGGDLAGVFVAEGDIVVERALRAGFVMRSVLIDAGRSSPLPGAVPAGVPVYAAEEELLLRLTGMGVYRGMLAVFERRPLPSADHVLVGARRVVVLENVVNPTNLGVILRSAAGLGIDAALVDKSSSDPLYRRAARVAMGEVYAFPYARLGRLPDDLGVLRDHGFELLALTPEEPSVPLDALALAPGQKVALLLGSEGHGLSPATLAAADRRVRIPMHGAVDSLNVGAAAAVACYAVVRA